MRVIRMFVMVAIAISAFSFAGKIAQAQEVDKVQEIRDRGQLNCGVDGALPGFSVVSEEGNSGLDVDFCRVIAVAIFGYQENIDDVINYVQLTAEVRFQALQAGEVDVLNRNTTWSFTRDITMNSDFGPTTFYDGQGLLAKVDDGFTGLADMDGATFCSTSGTTTEKNITDAYRNLFGSDPQLVLKATAAENLSDFEGGACDVLTSDKSQLASLRSASSNPSAYVLLPDTLSKEPLGPMYLSDDRNFGDVIDWAVYATFTAEEYGLNMENVQATCEEQAGATEGDGVYDAGLARFCGVTGDNFGENLGIANSFAVDIIRTVGNYGEIYERNVEPIGVPREGSLNDLWSNGGLIYSPAWR